MEDHLDSINENTNEIHSNYEFLQQLNAKIDKLSERIDSIHLFLKELATVDEKLSSDNASPTPQPVHPLSVIEKKVFMVIYTSGETSLNYAEISGRLNIKESLCRQYMINLIEKGIPILKEYKSNQVYVKIEKSFRDLQAKENLLDMNQKVLDF